MSLNTINLTNAQCKSLSKWQHGGIRTITQYDDEITIEIDNVYSMCAFGHIDCTSIACYNQSREIIGGDVIE